MVKNQHQDCIDTVENLSPHITLHTETYTRPTKNTGDRTARFIVHILASTMDFLFQERYGHRAIVLETIAAVPGMVGGLLQHLKSLRAIRTDNGKIQALLNEAENERMHLFIYSEIARPTTFERFLIMIVQFFFYHLYFLLYLLSPRTAHRVVGYFEEQAIHSYEHYLALIKNNILENVPAPSSAITYWKLQSEAKLSDVIHATIKDEMLHRDVNHALANDAREISLWN